MFRLCMHAAMLLAIVSSARTQTLTTKLFWAEATKIRSVNVDGSDPADVMTGLNFPTGLAIDNQSIPKKMYVAERGESRIVRADLDGSNPEDVITGISGIQDIELDLANGKLYWMRNTYSSDAVQRADKDGLNSNIEDLYTSTSASYDFLGIGLDHANATLYWTQRNNGCSDRIRRMNIDGSGFTTVVVHPRNNLIGPWDIDVAGNKIYWTDCGLSEDIIYSANLDGADIDTVVQEVDCQYFIIDSSSSKVYWTERSGVGCANLDGTEKTEIVTGSMSTRSGIALAFDMPTRVAGDEHRDIGRAGDAADASAADHDGGRAAGCVLDVAGRKVQIPGGVSPAHMEPGQQALECAPGVYLSIDRAVRSAKRLVK
jgi:hypothetical protein